jgi:hypothetical protein
MNAAQFFSPSIFAPASARPMKLEPLAPRHRGRAQQTRIYVRRGLQAVAATAALTTISLALPADAMASTASVRMVVQAKRARRSIGPRNADHTEIIDHRRVAMHPRRVLAFRPTAREVRKASPRPYRESEEE